MPCCCCCCCWSWVWLFLRCPPSCSAAPSGNTDIIMACWRAVAPLLPRRLERDFFLMGEGEARAKWEGRKEEPAAALSWVAGVR